jgi:tartrate-resistant acid phosphatase type 5
VMQFSEYSDTRDARSEGRHQSRLCCLTTFIVVMLAGCSAMDTPAPAAQGAPRGGVGANAARDAIGILVFGDHGYHLDYLEAEDFDPPRSREQFIAAEQAEWLEDKRPAAEFRPPAMTQHTNGSWVAASGLAPVARAMHSYCLEMKNCDFAAMLGDNIYPNGATRGADGHDDAARFEKIFAVPFGPFADLAPDFRIYSALGNHDWNTSREGAMDQVVYLAHTPPFFMGGIAYRVKPRAAHGDVELFVIDTTVMLAGHTVYEDALADDASEMPPTELAAPDPWVVPATAAERDMAAWLERALRDSTARWKIVLGHHPLWSSAGSKYEQARVLRNLILPSLCRYADAYLAGHDHTLELHFDDCSVALPGAKVAPLASIVSGAAAKQRALNTAFMQHQDKRYPQLTTDWARGLVWGFAHLSLSGDEATVRFIETADDGSGAMQTVHTARFARRSSAAPGMK